jgi:hypothetical protein
MRLPAPPHRRNSQKTSGLQRHESQLHPRGRDASPAWG